MDKQEAGVPFLSRIPLVGHAAKNTDNLKTRSELMIFHSTGRRSLATRDAVETSYDEDVRSKVGKEAVKIFPEPGVPTVEHREEVFEEEMIADKTVPEIWSKDLRQKETTRARAPSPGRRTGLPGVNRDADTPVRVTNPHHFAFFFFFPFGFFQELKGTTPLSPAQVSYCPAILATLSG